MGDGGGGTGVEISEQQVDANLVLVANSIVSLTVRYAPHVYSDGRGAWCAYPSAAASCASDALSRVSVGIVEV